MEAKDAWNILLVDDDEDDYILTREMLADLHGKKARLSWASGYAEGREMFLSNPDYDLVLMDYDLSIYSGIDLAKELIGYRPYLPIVLLTGRGTPLVDVEAMEAGIAFYLTKNEANSLLLERVIRYAMQRKQMERQIHQQNERLELLSDLSTNLLKKKDPVKLLDQVSQQLTKMLDMDVFVHYRRSDDGTYLNLAAIGGYPEAVRSQLKRLEFGQAVCGRVALTGRPMTVQDVQSNTEEYTQLIRRLGIQSYCCHPLYVRQQVYGTLSFGSRTRTYLDENMVDLLRTVCDLIAVAFERLETEPIPLAVERRITVTG